MIKKCNILVNTGTPDKPDVLHVRRFLSEFLNDRRVIDLPWLIRKILVNLIIVPIRSPRSAGLYRRLWTGGGSPLLVNLEDLVKGLRKKFGENIAVYGAMRYGNPSLKAILEKIKNENYDEIVIFPLYPQYASSTTGSVHDLVMKEIRKWNVIPPVRFISQFYSHPLFIGAFINNIRQYDPVSYDHILFSFHGLPLRHINKVHPEISYKDCDCRHVLPEHGKYCYRAACYETARLLAGGLGLSMNNFSVSFQSRLAKNWLSPFTDQVLRELAAAGKRRVLVVAPSFVADCLETIVEIGEEYNVLFKEAGGEELVLVRSLNDSDMWIDAITGIAGL